MEECKIKAEDNFIKVKYNKEDVNKGISHCYKALDENKIVEEENFLINSTDDALIIRKLINNEFMKKEDSICDGNIAMNNCNECIEDFKGYCIKCSPVSHILNRYDSQKNTKLNINNTIPTDIFEIRETFGRNCIVALKTLPKYVILGPFEGIFPIESVNGWTWKIKNRKLLNIENGNWLKYVYHADINNLKGFQFDGDLYFQTNREITEGEELSVCYNVENMGNTIDENESYYHPIEQNKSQKLFGCTVCCLGFSEDVHLIAHKAICLHSESNRNVTEIIQCNRCGIWLEKQEYLEYHLGNCREKKFRFPAVLDLDQIDVENNDDNCIRNNESPNEVSRNNRDIVGNKKQFKCTKCSFQTMYKCSFKLHYRNAHIVTVMKDYKCPECPLQTNYKDYLKKHIKTKHTNPIEKDYKCSECDYETNYSSSLQLHIKLKHSNRIEYEYKCSQCTYETNCKSNLTRHIKYIHFDRIEKDHQCARCDYQTNRKDLLKEHIKNLHTNREGKDYRCTECVFETNYKKSLRKHVQIKHTEPNVRQYKCFHCSFETNRKDCLKQHIKYKHRN